MNITKKIATWPWGTILTIVLIIAAAAIGELVMGRIAICKCGYVSLWYGNIYGSGNSQHLTDWYTLSHIIHGMLFYFFLWLVARRLPVRTRLILAILIETTWELLENSPLIINRYRAVTAALDYTGDSVINSMSDIVAAMLGFLAAYKLSPKIIVASIIGMELLAGFVVRDNLTFNVIMLIHPVQAIKDWQLAADFVPESVRQLNKSKQEDPLNATYLIENKAIALREGKNLSVDSYAGTTTTQIFGKPVYGEVGAGPDTAVMFLTQDAGGSGTFFYAVAAYKKDGKYVGTNAIFLGDRIAPQTINIVDGVAQVNYADRKTTDSFATPPSVGVTKYLSLKIDKGILTLSEVK